MNWLWIVLAVTAIAALAVVYGKRRAAALLPAGSHSPGFALLNQHGEVVHSSSLAGVWHVVYFYPKDDTPGCTKEACAFRDNGDIFAELGVRVFGVSRDEVDSHKAFADKYDLAFDLLADPTGRVVKAFGAASPAPGIASRISYLIDGEGTIRKVYPSVTPVEHADEIVADVKTLRMA